MVLDDRRMKLHEIAETIGISKERVGYILHEELDMKKLCTRWVPCLLKKKKKRTHMKISESAWSILTKIKLILCVDLLLWMTLGFTITHQNPNGTEPGCSAPKKTRSVPSAGKVMASVFWDAEGIFLLIILKRVKQ
jgi:hypothetical protein